MSPALLEKIIEELVPILSSGVISKVHQPDERRIILKVFARGREYRLLISAHPRLSRLHLTTRHYENPDVPPRFCAFLRSRITGARIKGLGLIKGERIAEISLKVKADAGWETFMLIAELFGRSANVILIDAKGVIQESLRHFPVGESPRPVVPGIKLNALALPRENIIAGNGATGLTEKEDGVTWNEAADEYYANIERGEEEEGGKTRLKKAVADAEKRALRRLENLKRDKEAAQLDMDAFRLGELIVRNLGRIRQGQTETTLDDYAKTPPEKTTVPLDPALSPRENAERYFKRTHKAKRGVEIIGLRTHETKKELEYIAGLKYELEDAGDEEDLGALEAELIEAGYMKTKRHGKAGAPPDEKAEPVRRYTSSDGFEILCGKSGQGNDLIVKRHAKAEDIWFHAHGVPGSHVLIKTAGRAKEITGKTVEEAAGLAAFFSKAKHASKAEVIYADARFVKKPKGAKPGMVVVKEYRTIMVRPANMEMKGDEGVFHGHGEKR